MNQTADERRQNLRVPLDIPYFVTLNMIDGKNYKVMLSNISLDGMQMDLPGHIGAEEIPGNSVVTVQGFPEALAFMNGVHGRIAWVTKGHCGVQFDDKVGMTPEELYEILDNL